MNSKPHRTNSDFQLRNFMVGDCKTADGAWNLMYGQKIDMAVKVKHSVAQKMRRDAKIAEAQEILDLPEELTTKSARLNAQADIIEHTAGDEIWELNAQAAIAELATIEALMAELEPFRKFAHLPLLEAMEAAQQDEWLFELISRAENHLLTSGSIPHDDLRFMRNHPDFETQIVPHIHELTEKMKRIQSSSEGLMLMSKPFQCLKLT